MSDLGTLLELLHGAATAYRSVHAAYEHETDLVVSREAAQRWAASQAPGTVGIISASSGDDAGPASYIRRSYVEVWRQESQFWRVETEDEDANHTIIFNGPRWWSINDRFGARTNVRDDGTYDDNQHTDIPRMLQVLLDPSPIPMLATLSIEGETSVAGRPAITASGTMRDHLDLMMFDFPFADRIELAVDAEKGVLLEFSGFLDSRLFLHWRAENIEFDIAIGKDVFEGPAGIGYEPLPDYSRRDFFPQKDS